MNKESTVLKISILENKINPGRSTVNSPKPIIMHKITSSVSTQELLYPNFKRVLKMLNFRIIIRICPGLKYLQRKCTPKKIKKNIMTPGVLVRIVCTVAFVDIYIVSFFFNFQKIHTGRFYSFKICITNILIGSNHTNLKRHTGFINIIHPK